MDYLFSKGVQVHFTISQFNDFTILTEVTMSTSSRQEAMEGEPVRRHVSDAVLNYDKPVYGMFIAVKIDTNTAETFRHGVWYARGDQQQRLNIVPFTLAQFRKYFISMFEIGKASPECLSRLIDVCSKKRDCMEAPAWKEYIDVSVQKPWMALQPVVSKLFLAEESTSYGQEKSLNMDFPFGIYFGSRIKNAQDGRIGVVIDVHIDTILIAFEGEDRPDMILADKESFKQGKFTVA